MENEGKKSGAYSWGTYGTPPYMLMNWHDTMDQMFTLAHEAGHSMHSWFSRKHQPYPYSGYTLFLAEIDLRCSLSDEISDRSVFQSSNISCLRSLCWVF